MTHHMKRRDFLQATGIALACALVSGCEPVLQSITQPAPGPTSPPSPSPSPVKPTMTTAVEPSSTPSTGRPAILRFYPEISSRVVKTEAAGVWKDDRLDAAVLQSMVDASITKLTGLASPQAAWQALFRPSERIAIKVNAFCNCHWWTHAALVEAVTGGLVAAGIPAENILVFDQMTWELQNAGFKVNQNGSGVRCMGSEDQYNQRFKIAGADVSITNHLLNCDAIINIPLLKQHDLAGISFAMKNHFGSVDLSARLHGENHIQHSIAELNAVEEIHSRTRLLIGDALEVVLGNFWTKAVKGNSILMSYDPVAHDAIGLQHFDSILEQRGDNPAGSNSLANQWLTLAAGLGLGAYDLKNIELLEQKL